MTRLLCAALLACSSASAAELSPAQCRALGVEVADDRAATGQVVRERHSIFSRCKDCHDPAAFGASIRIGSAHEYEINYETETGRQFAVCRAEYEVGRFIPPPKPGR